MSDYRQLADSEFEKLQALRDERARIEGEIRRVTELIRALIKAMPDEDRGPYLARLTASAVQQAGLTFTIRNILQHSGEFMNAVEIKKKLDEIGYNFSDYTSNPLSSIHAILKRFKPSEVRTHSQMDGGVAYQWKTKKKRMTTAQLMGAISALSGEPKKK